MTNPFERSSRKHCKHLIGGEGPNFWLQGTVNITWARESLDRLEQGTPLWCGDWTVWATPQSEQLRDTYRMREPSFVTEHVDLHTESLKAA